LQMMQMKYLLRRLDPIRYYPYSPDIRIRRAVEELLGVYQPMVENARGGELLMTPPPEGVLKGESVPVENDSEEFKELLAKARERRIKSLERQDRLKKEVDE